MRALHAVWVAAMSLALFSFTSFCIFTVWALNSPAFPAEQCLITKDLWTKHSVAAGHESLGDMPERQVPAFVAAFNANPPSVGPANAVTVFRWFEGAPVFRVAFFKDDCFIDSYDLPLPVLQRMMGEARDGEEM